MKDSGESAPANEGTPTLDDVYRDRNLLAQLAGELARRLGMTVGIGLDSDEPEWPVLYIDLPTGQVSWHLPQNELTGTYERYPGSWDGHSMGAKQDRIRTFLASAGQEPC